MIGYVTLGTNDLPKAIQFYDALFDSIGIGRFIEKDGFYVAWGTEHATSLAVTVPFNGAAATVGNGVMVALAMESPEKVKAFYEKALQLGASDEGAPGFRPEEATSGYYGSYFRDMDGNKLNAFCMVAE